VIRRHSRLRLVEQERDLMRTACRFNAELMDFIRPHVLLGAKTANLDRLIHEYTLDHGTGGTVISQKRF